MQSPPTFRSPVALVPNTGINFLDFGFDLARLPKVTGQFWEERREDQPTAEGKVAAVLRKLEPDAEGRLVFWDPDKGVLREAPEEETYSVSGQKALECFERQWVPVPFLRVAARDELGRDSYDSGPINWARVYISPVAEEERGEETHRVTIVLDTALKPRSEGHPYLAPAPDDSEQMETFRFVTEHAANAWFLNEPWVALWLQETFQDLKRRSKGGRALSEADFPNACEHWARYATLLDLLGQAIKVPDLKLADVVSGMRFNPIDVDLVLDVGNSRTCGILIESLPGESFNMRDSYVLELRDLSRPERSYAEPFESRVEFARASFGREHLSRRSGRADAFVWPSLVRVGHEAARLASEGDGTEGATGLSSPKRYLWDKRPARQPWHGNVAELPSWQKQADIRGPATQLVTDDGEVIDPFAKLKAGEEPPVSMIYPVFSRSSLYTYLVAEVLLQALMMINAPANRSRRRHSDIPRRLRRLIFTLPPAMPLAEQRIMRKRVEAAVSLAWALLGWDIDGNELYKRPTIHLNWDEASGTQLVYLYSEITQKLQTTAADFFAMLGKPRPERGEGPTLRIASIDVGGGTTDLMITTYALEGQRALVPHQEFREGFKIAGDDVLEAVVEQQVLAAIARHLATCGASDEWELLRSLFGGERAGVAEQTRLKRAVFVSQVLMPIGLGLLHDYERLGSDATPTSRGFAEFFPTDRPPSPEVLAYLEKEAARVCSQPFHLADVSFDMNPKRLERTIINVLESVLSDLCEVINAYDCDVVLLSGRPSRLPAIQRYVVSLLPLRPDRVIAMHRYRAGEWYPFGDTRFRVADPKTTAAVGAMLCAVAEGQVANFLFRSSQLRMRSTARYLGEMELDGQIRKELFSNVDLEAGEGGGSCDVTLYAPLFIGFRQLPIKRWTATPLYYLEFRNPQEAHRLKLPMTVTLERRDAAREEEREESLEDFRLVEAVDQEGSSRRREVELRLQTLKSEAGYWLDTGVLSLV